jgi:HAD superfamily hydrolase (TIGR01509 family)
MVAHAFENIDLQGVKGVLIDLDNTLYSYTLNNERSIEKCALRSEHHYGISRQDFDLCFSRGREMVHRELHGQAASHSRLLYFQKFSEIHFGYSHPAFALDMEHLYWSDFVSGMTFYPGAEDFLKKIKMLGLKSCLVTDLTAQIQCQKWEKLGLGRYIDFMLSSEEAGIEKPDAHIFEKALFKLGLRHDEVVMIGDNEEKDILGAEAIGIKAYLIKYQ